MEKEASLDALDALAGLKRDGEHSWVSRVAMMRKRRACRLPDNRLVKPFAKFE